LFRYILGQLTIVQNLDMLHNELLIVKGDAGKFLEKFQDFPAIAHTVLEAPPICGGLSIPPNKANSITRPTEELL
jgi:hypothetical protein